MTKDLIRPRAPLLATATIVLTAVAGLMAWHVVYQLPPLQTHAIAGRDVGATLRAAYQSAPPAAAAGMRMLEGGSDFTAALMKVQPIEDVAKRTTARAQQTSDSRLPRLFQAGLAMLALERLDTPPDQQWKTLEPYLSGLGDASFAHFHRNASASLASAMISLGLSPGVAAEAVEMRFGSSYGPFLQYFTGRLFALAAAFSQAEATAPAAQQCRSIALHLLKQWTLDPGPAGLRLLAADLLIRELRASGAGDPTTQRVAADLGQWTQAYRRESHRRPIGQFDLSRQPALAVGEYRQLRNALAMTAWTGGAAAAAALLLIALSWTALGGKKLDSTTNMRGMTLGTAGGAFIVLCAMAILFRADDLLADFSWAWIRLPLYAGGMTLVMAGMAAFISAGAVQRTGTLADRLFAIFCGSSGGAVLLAAAFLLAVLYAGSAQRAYDAATEVAFRDEFRAMAGTSADQFLASLRAWKP